MAEAEVVVVVVLSLQRRTPGGVSRWQFRSGKVLVAWCLVVQLPLVLR